MAACWFCVNEIAGNLKLSFGAICYWIVRNSMSERNFLWADCMTGEVKKNARAFRHLESRKRRGVCLAYFRSSPHLRAVYLLRDLPLELGQFTAIYRNDEEIL